MKERFWALWNRLMENSWARRLWQFVKFGIVGLSNTLISIGVYQLCVHVLGWNYLAANACGLAISVVNAYYWNNRVVFGQGEQKTMGQHVLGYLKSLTAYGGTFLLDSALLIFWVEVVHTGETLAPFLNLCVTIPLNFLVNKYWTFRKKK